MRQTAIALYTLGSLLLVYGLFATGPKPDKAAVIAGAIPVLAAAAINRSLRRAQSQTSSQTSRTTDWLQGKRRRPLRTGLSLLSVLFAIANVLFSIRRIQAPGITSSPGSCRSMSF
jgi:hypothetical protein